MSRLSLKNDFKDGEVLYGKELNTNNDATVAAVNDNYEKILELQQLKADITNVDEKLATKVDNSTFNDAINSLNTTKADKSALNLKADKSEVALKADKTELQEGLAAKADADYVNTQLGLKADKTEVNSALNLKADKTEVVGKADTSYVNGQLALKADKTELASGLAGKADTTYVDNQLAGKVNVNTYNDDMADKADKSTIGNLEDLNTSNKDSIVDAINSIQTSTVPIATTSTPGIVKPDGTTITIDSDGTIHSVGGGGGTGGTTDYNALDNKPQIEGNTLNGNKTADELGLMSKTNINSALANKADKSTTYTKTEVDNAINTATSGKADKTYVDTQLGNKVDTSTYTAGLADKVDNATYTAGLATKADVLTTYTKDEVDGKINTAVAPKADKTYVDTQLTTKANANNVYTKEEIDSDLEELSSSFTTSLNTKANASDVYSKTDVDSKINTAVSTKADTSYVNEQLALKADKSDTYTKEEVDNLVDNQTVAGDTLPIGSITPYSGISTPSNWLLCDGREISREVYSQLFAVIGTSYGAGDGSTTFNLPDLTFTGTEINNYIIKAKQSAGVVATVVDTLESSSATDALSANMGKKLNNMANKVVYNETLSSASNTINIQNLDLLSDGGTYEFEALLWTNGSNSVDCQITFNDSDDSGYFYVQDINYGQLSGDGNLTKISKYNQAKTSITSWTTNPQSQFYPIIFRGKLYLVNSMVSDDYKIHFDITYSQILDSRQIVNRMTGLYDPDVETLTSMKIYSGNASLLYTTKSRVIIRKK